MLPVQASAVRRCEELERVFDDGGWPFVGNEMGGAVDDFQRQVVGVVLVAAEESGADDRILSPGEQTGRGSQPGVPVCPPMIRPASRMMKPR